MPELKVRMKEPLRQAIQDAAAANDLSMNAEAVKRLDQSFRDDRIERLLQEILGLLGELK